MSQTFLLDINNTQITLHYGTILTDAILDNTVSNDDHLLAEVNRNPDDPSILGLKNLSQQEWQITFTDGETKTIAPGRSIKLEDNMVIHFGDSAGTVRRINTEQIDTILFSASLSEQTLTTPTPKISSQSENLKPQLKKSNTPLNTSFFSESRVKNVKIDTQKSKELDYRPLKTQRESSFLWRILGLLVLLWLIFNGSLFFYQFIESQSAPTTVEPENNICDEVERKKETYRGKINWAAVDEAFWQQTDYPYGQPLDSSYPDYQYYRQKWCEIANQYLEG
ncbi:MAG: hypothetical protein VKL42_04505 [Snowella sp.]|nr:hypothetical protein [Snowella sp.]